MAELFTVENLVTLFLLTMLQAVLGFDNLLYISLESKSAPPEKQSMVRKWGVGIAILLRIVLLFVLVSMISAFQDPILNIHWSEYVTAHFNVHSIIVLLGGIFIIYTSTKEIWHMMLIEKDAHAEKKPRSIATIIAWIVGMNLVFSFDSILSAMALTDNFWVMATAIVIGGILMIKMADTVSNFLQKNRLYEVLGLFILFVVGIMLLTEGGHLAHISFWENPITPMSKTTFYFVIVVLVLTDIVQGQYQKKLIKGKEEKNLE